MLAIFFFCICALLFLFTHSFAVPSPVSVARNRTELLLKHSFAASWYIGRDPRRSNACVERG